MHLVMRRRRFLLGCCGTGAAMLSTANASSNERTDGTADPTRSEYNILICGPNGGRTDRWARAVAQGLNGGFAGHSTLALRGVGGEDGVTGANRLQVLVIPDGQTAAMIPSEAAIAFLAGDPRVHFQPGDWIPVMAGLNASVLVVRGGLGRLSDPAPIRLAAASPESPDMAALLAFHRLGVTTAPIFGLRGPSAVARAFAAGEADAILLTGEEIPADAASLAAEGGIPVGTLGVVDDHDRVVADPMFPGLPTVHAIAQDRRAAPLPAPLEHAYRAVAAATRIDFLLVLPHLTTPSAIAAWRQSATIATTTPALQAAAAASSIGLTVVGAAAAVAPFDVSADGLLALRGFLFEHFGWRPS